MEIASDRALGGHWFHLIQMFGFDLVKGDGTKYYEFMLMYTDDILAISSPPRDFGCSSPSV
jgi:hypothetical protein